MVRWGWVVVRPGCVVVRDGIVVVRFGIVVVRFGVVVVVRFGTVVVRFGVVVVRFGTVVVRFGIAGRCTGALGRAGPLDRIEADGGGVAGTFSVSFFCPLPANAGTAITSRSSANFRRTFSLPFNELMGASP